MRDEFGWLVGKTSILDSAPRNMSDSDAELSAGEPETVEEVEEQISKWYINTLHCLFAECHETRFTSSTNQNTHDTRKFKRCSRGFGGLVICYPRYASR